MRFHTPSAGCRLWTLRKASLKRSIADAVGDFRVLQICYSSKQRSYLTEPLPIIPPPELSPPEWTQQSHFERLSSTRRSGLRGGNVRYQRSNRRAHGPVRFLTLELLC